jgi:hypothetical protein
MKKKAFRAQKVARPGYPMLRELDAGALRRWGLAAVGGLLLGGTGCARSPSAPPPATLTTQAATGTATETGTGTGPDAGDWPVVEPPMGGAPPPQRVPPDLGERDKASAAFRIAMNEADKGKAKPPRTPPPPPQGRPHKGGKMPMPRAKKQGDGW